MPKLVDHNAYREELLSRVFELFALHGYRGVTMRSIAKHLGVSTGKLYHYFPTKEALFEQTAERVAQSDVETAIASLSSVKEPRDRLRAALCFILGAEAHLQNFLFVMLEYRRVSESDEPPAITNRAFEAYTQALADHFPELDAHGIRLLVFSAVGMLIVRLLHRQELNVEDFLQGLEPILSTLTM